MKAKLSRSQLENLLVRLYAEQDLTQEHLPYTKQFEVIYDQVSDRVATPIDRCGVNEMLLALRKAGRLNNKETGKVTARKDKPANGGLLKILENKS